jgi:hypothetical protein
MTYRLAIVDSDATPPELRRIAGSRSAITK